MKRCSLSSFLSVTISPSARSGSGFFPAGLLILVRVLVYRGIPRETQRGMIRLEAVTGAESIDHHVIIDGVCHLARRKAAPDQAVQAVLLRREILFHALRREIHVARADGFVRVLRARLGLIAAGFAVIVLLAVKAADKAARGGHGFLGKAQRVGTHIRDKADRAFAGDIHAFVELLRDAHRAPRRESQTAARLLLQRGGDERRRRLRWRSPRLTEPISHAAFSTAAMTSSTSFSL